MAKPVIDSVPASGPVGAGRSAVTATMAPADPAVEVEELEDGARIPALACSEACARSST